MRDGSICDVVSDKCDLVAPNRDEETPRQGQEVGPWLES